MSTNANEVVCPNCKTAFTIDESKFEDIVKQIRDGEFEAELMRRLDEAERAKQTEIELAEAIAAHADGVERMKLVNNIVRELAKDEDDDELSLSMESQQERDRSHELQRNTQTNSLYLAEKSERTNKQKTAYRRFFDI